jgi:hypothetical protein
MGNHGGLPHMMMDVAIAEVADASRSQVGTSTTHSLDVEKVWGTTPTLFIVWETKLLVNMSEC